MAVNKSFILFDDYQRDHLLPFTYTRPVAEIRMGILTIRQKWEKWTSQLFSHKTQDYLQEKYTLATGDQNLVINGCVTPNHQIVDEVMQLRCGELLMKDSFFIAGCLDKTTMESFSGLPPKDHVVVQAKSEFRNITRTWQIFRLNGIELESDFDLLTRRRNSAPLSSTNRIINPGNVFVESGASLEYVTINASTGPVYIGSNATAMEGSLIRGPFALCEGATVKMGARIYGPTTIGPYSKVGGEITNSVIMGYTYKVHDGYMGSSVIGEWCNFGAGSNTSNLKNNYALLPVWDYATGKAEETGLQFCGLIMGDYSRCGINTMFNTGTIVGISSNIFGPGFPGDFIPSFSWGGAAGFETYRLTNAIETIRVGMELHNMSLSEADKNMIEQIFIRSGRYRK